MEESFESEILDESDEELDELELDDEEQLKQNFFFYSFLHIQDKK